MPGYLVEINEVDFDKEVLGADLPVLVDFFTPPCAPCKALLPLLENLARKYPRIKIVKINAWNNQKLCAQFKVIGVPALLFFKNGQNVSRINGAEASSEKIIEDAIKKTVGD